MADDRGVINPNETPAVPEGLADHLEGDHSALAEAAWKQARGSMVAFEQLLREHSRGELDLLGGGSSEGEDRSTGGGSTGEAAEGTGDSGPAGGAPSGLDTVVGSARGGD